MPTTSRLGWKYPTEDQKDWWDVWVSLANQMDADVWASFENSFLLLRGGGDISLNTVTNTVTWTADLYLLSLLSGMAARVPAGSETLEDGNIAYIEISRPLAGNFDTTLQVTSNPLISQNQRNTVFVMMRSGSELIMRPFQAQPPSITFDDEFDTGSIASGGAYWEREINIGSIKTGTFQLVQLSLDTGTSTDADILLYDRDPSDIDAVTLYQATGKDVTVDPFKDPNIWWGEVNVQGSLWARVYNQGGTATSFKLRVRLRNDDTETFTE